jgi:hypothetical protein
VRSLPEEPLRNACVGDLSVGHNMGLRIFDEPPAAAAAGCAGCVVRERARQLIADYGVKTQGEHAPIRSLSGGNVQRAVLARELSEDADLLLVSNPVFGLDFAAVAEIHGRLVAARNRGAAVLLVSEDLDELLQLADRIVVMSEGRIVFECDAARRRPAALLGRHMGGHGGGTACRREATSTAGGGRMTTHRAAAPSTTPGAGPHGAGGDRHAARLRRARRLRRLLGNDVTLLHPAIAPIAALLAGLARARLAGAAHPRMPPPRPVDCPPAKRDRGNPTLRIGDPGPMGRLLVAGEPGADIIPALAPAGWRMGDRQTRQGHVLGHGPARAAAGAGITHLVFTGVTTEVCVQTSDARGQRPRLRVPDRRGRHRELLPRVQARDAGDDRRPGRHRRLVHELGRAAASAVTRRRPDVAASPGGATCAGRISRQRP